MFLYFYEDSLGGVVSDGNCWEEGYRVVLLIVIKKRFKLVLFFC